MSRTRSTTLHEANAAAADAAVEVRDEVLRRREQRSSTRPRPVGGRETGWHRFIVDVWITNLNTVEFGLYKRSRNRAKSRQFTLDMDVFAEILENGERTGVLAYREDLWTKATGLDRRLVFKLFSEDLNWRATMDLLLARSVQQTLGARGLPVMTYAVNTDDHEQVVYIERSANKWPLLPENFSFFLMDDNRVEFFRIRQDFIRFGEDYTVLNERNETVARIDGAVFSIGGKWRVKIRPDYKSPRLHTVLKLFCGLIIFNRDCRRHVRRLYTEIRKGRHRPKLERHETDLYMNPRRIR